MIRTQLDDATRDELQALRRKALPPKVRDRIEMVTLSDAGWSPPRIAAHLGCCGQTVRDLLRGFLARGTDALYPFRSGPAPDVDRRDRVADELRRLLAEERTWTSRQLAEALAERGIPLGARQVRRHLKRIERRLPPHRLDAEAQAGPGQGRAGRPGPGQPQGEGGRRAGGPLLPRRVRLLADAAGRLQLDPAGPSGSWSATRRRRGGGSTPWPPTGPTAGRRGWRCSRPSGPGTAYDLLGFLKALAVVEGPPGGGPGQRQHPHEQGHPPGPARAWPPRGSTCTSCRRTARS